MANRFFGEFVGFSVLSDDFIPTPMVYEALILVTLKGLVPATQWTQTLSPPPTVKCCSWVTKPTTKKKILLFHKISWLWISVQLAQIPPCILGAKKTMFNQNCILLPDNSESSIADWPIRLHILGMRMCGRRWRLVWMLRMIIGLSRREDSLLVSSSPSPALHEWHRDRHSHSGMSTWTNHSHEVAVNLAML